MKTITRFALFFSGQMPLMALAAEPASLATAAAPSASDSLGRMVLGTVIVLLVIAAIAWLLKRMMPGQGLPRNDIIKQVGVVQLTPRERVVVLEVAGRWLIVGVGTGQMTALGEVTPPAADSEPVVPDSDGAAIDPQASFAMRLQQAMQHSLQQTVKSFKNKP